MAASPKRKVEIALSRVGAFDVLANKARDLPVLSAKFMECSPSRSGGDAAWKASRDLEQLLVRGRSLEPNLDNDRYITGQISGPKRQKIYGHKGTIRGQPAHARKRKPRLLTPTCITFRPRNARMETSFHLSFEAVTKNHTDFGLPVASGRRASADDHCKYLEDAEKTAYPSSRKPINAEAYGEYHEREHALAIDDGHHLFTNIQGGQEDRLELFRAANSNETSMSPPKLTIDVLEGTKLIADFIAFALDDPTLAASVQSHVEDKSAKPFRHGEELKHVEDLAKVTFEGDAAIRAHDLLQSLGWREHGKDYDQSARAGISWHSGRSGRVQMRLVGEIPHELSPEGRSRFMKSLSERFDKLGVPYVAVVHKPTAANHKSNWHFHLVYWDRPTERFDPELIAQRNTAGTTLPGYSKRYADLREQALRDPNVIAQAGKYDFEVVYTYKDAKGRNRTTFPFRQNKNRECTRTAFIPELRKFIAEVSNRELRMAGVSRRVRAERYDKFGINKKPGIHLNDRNNRLELAGIPTEEGTANEERQWEYIIATLEEQKRLEIGVLRSHEVLNPPPAIKRDARRGKIESEWLEIKCAEIELRHNARVAQAMQTRMLSRPDRLSKQSRRALESIANGTAGPVLVKKKTFHTRRMQILDEHRANTELLFRDEFALPRQLTEEADRLALEARAAEERIADCLAPATEPGMAKAKFETSIQARKDEAKAEVEATSARGDCTTNLAGKRIGDAKDAKPHDPHEAYAESYRKKLVSEHIDKLVENNIPFVLAEAVDGNRPLLIARISGEDARQHNLFNQIWAETNHEKARLKGIYQARQRTAAPKQVAPDQSEDNHSSSTAARASQTRTQETDKTTTARRPATVASTQVPSTEHPKSVRSQLMNDTKAAAVPRSDNKNELDKPPVGADRSPAAKATSKKSNGSASQGPSANDPGFNALFEKSTGDQFKRRRRSEAMKEAAAAVSAIGAIADGTGNRGNALTNSTATSNGSAPRAPSDDHDASGEREAASLADIASRLLPKIREVERAARVRSAMASARERNAILYEREPNQFYLICSDVWSGHRRVPAETEAEWEALRKLSAIQMREIEQLADFTVTHHALLADASSREGRDEEADEAQLDKLLADWATNKDVDRALAACARLPSPGAVDENSRERRTRFFILSLDHQNDLAELEGQIRADSANQDGTPSVASKPEHKPDDRKPVQGEIHSPIESKDRKSSGPTIDMLRQQHTQGWEL